MSPGKIKTVLSTPRRAIAYPHPHGRPRARHTPANHQQQQRQVAAAASSPWKPPNRFYSHGVVGLHEEIEDFYNWISPSAAEVRMRRHVLAEVTGVIKRLYPYARIDTFGSFETGLYLPSSDLDLIIFGKWPQLPFSTLKEELIKSNVCKPDGVKILDKATVPILKLTHGATELKVDISFNMTNGLQTAEFIRRYATQYRCFPKLFLFLKQFFYQRDLNESFTGGISSYGLALMVISFLQLHVRMEDLVDEARLNLGVLLLELLELYGCHFHYGDVTIRVCGRGSYINKSQMKLLTPKGMNPGMLSIDDPIQPGNDIGRNCFSAMQVKQAFEFAFGVLNRQVLNPGRANSGILHHVVSMAPVDLDYRQWVDGAF